jgi:hypothetical protein
MRRVTLQVAVLGLGLGAVIGCSNQGLDSLATAQRAAIVNGQLSVPEDNAVVSVSNSGAGCTGTLIAPTVVLTALHCVAEYDVRFRFNCQPDGTLAPGSTAGQVGAAADAQGVLITLGVELGSMRVRGKAIYTTGSTDACHDDLAVVVLESPPAIGDAPLVSLRFGRDTRKGERTRAVGYGAVEQTDTPLGRQVRNGLTVRGVGGPDASTPGDVGVLPRTLQIGEGPCQGDSGGPLFSEETGAQIGVYSLLLNSTCTGNDVRNAYTLVAPFEPLIRMALESEGVEPLLEPEEPSGSGGEGGAGLDPGGAEAGGPVGSGGSDSGGTNATGATTGDGAAPADPREASGRGSFQDSSCSYRLIRAPERGWWMTASSALVLGSLAAARRRARRRGNRASVS